MTDPLRRDAGGIEKAREHVQAVPMMVTGSLIADTVAALASADPVMGDVDR